MKKLYISLCVVVACLVSCQNKTQLAGEMPQAAGKMLYLEQVGAQRTTTIDSIKVGEDGAYRFRFEPQELPELYALRTAGYREFIVIDSLGINEEESAQIAQLRESLVQKSLEEHKTFARDLIIKNPKALSAYYGLLQQKEGLFIFNPYEKVDRQCYAAVATAWHVYYPKTTRGKTIYNLVNNIIIEERRLQQNLALQQMIDEAESAFLDITLPDEDGINQTLSDLRGDVILLDFSAVEMEQSNAYIFELRELYNKYARRGLAIYQVSADQNKLLWEDAVASLPWITVRSEYGAYSSYFQQYNVQRIPTRFLFNRKGEIIARDLSFEALPKAIEKCL